MPFALIHTVGSTTCCLHAGIPVSRLSAFVLLHVLGHLSLVIRLCFHAAADHGFMGQLTSLVNTNLTVSPALTVM